MKQRLAPMVVAFAVAMGCTIRFDWPDHHVDVALHGEPGGMETVTRDQTALRVDAVDLGIVTTELVTCNDIDRGRTELPGFAMLGPSVAFAHVEPTSTIDATPRAVSAIAKNDVVFAELSPPADRYCALVFELGPLSSDMDSMAGTTARIVGASRPRGADNWTRFEWRTSARATFRFDFEEPVELGDESQRVRFGIRPNIVEWFEQVDNETTDEEAAYRVLEAAVGAVECVR